MRTIPGLEEHLKPLDDLITYGFLPSLFGSSLTTVERDIMALPARFGGLGVAVLCDRAPREYSASKLVTLDNVAAIKQPSEIMPQFNQHRVSQVKTDLTNLHKERLECLKNQVSLKTKRALELAEEKGSSNWLTTLPLKSQGFVLSKSDFSDALNLRYHRELRGTPVRCPCGQSFSITHALNCKAGGFIHIRHDSLRDLNARLLGKVHQDVQTEPGLQHMANHSGHPSSANTADDARLDIRARGFWREGQSAFCDVRVTNPFAASQLKTPLSKIFDKHEGDKKREYNWRVMNIENGTFTPIVYIVNGSVGPEGTKFYKHLCTKISNKNEERYTDVMNWVRCKISFMCLKTAIMCVRGTRVSKSNMTVDYISNDFKFDVNEANMDR